MAATDRAGRAHREKTLAPGNLAGTAALTAGFGTVASFTPVSAAVSAGFGFGNINGGFSAKSSVHEFQGEVVAQVGAALRPRTRSAAVAKTEKILEDVAEAGKNVFKPAKTGESGPLQPGMTELIVKTSFFTIPKNLIRLGCLFELLFGVLISGVAVRMVFQG